MAEAIFVAMAIRAGGSFAHSAIAMKALADTWCQPVGIKVAVTSGYYCLRGVW